MENDVSKPFRQKTRCQISELKHLPWTGKKCCASHGFGKGCTPGGIRFGSLLGALTEFFFILFFTLEIYEPCCGGVDAGGSRSVIQLVTSFSTASATSGRSWWRAWYPPSKIWENIWPRQRDDMHKNPLTTVIVKENRTFSNMTAIWWALNLNQSMI